MHEKPKSLRVELQERSARPYVWLDVSYNGKFPPTELFADLEMLGWKPPTPAPPPRSAIDWSTSDERTGDPFSIIDYMVDDVVAAPPGTGDRGRWTAGERVAYLKGLDGVLRRHDLTATPVTTLPPPPALAAAAVATGEVPSPSATAPKTEGAGASTRDRIREATAPAQASAAPDQVADDTRLVYLEVMLVAGMKQMATQALSSLDLPAKIESRERVKTVQFRGSTSTTTEMGQVLVTVVPASEVHRITAILLNANAVVSEDDFTVGRLRADALGAFLGTDTSSPPAATAPSTVGSGGAKVTIVVAASMFDYLSGLAVESGGTVVETARTQKIKRMSHRGASHEQVVPAMRGVIAIAPPKLDGLLAGFKEFGLSIDDPEEVTIELPMPPGSLEHAADEGSTIPTATPVMSPVHGADASPRPGDHRSDEIEGARQVSELPGASMTAATASVGPSAAPS